MHGFHQFTTIGFDAMTTIVVGVKKPSFPNSWKTSEFKMLQATADWSDPLTSLSHCLIFAGWSIQISMSV